MCTLDAAPGLTGARVRSNEWTDEIMTFTAAAALPSQALAALELKGDGHAVLPDIHAAFDRGLTFQALVCPADLKERGTLLTLGERAGLRPLSVFVAAGSGDLVVEVVDGSGTARTLVAPAALAVGKWAHVSVVLSERGTARMVVDGSERASAKLPLPAAGARRLGYIGRSLARADETFKGSLAEVRLWTRDLSNDEIEASRRRRLSGEEPELAGYWPLDRVVDGRLADLSGHGRSARPVAAAVVAAPDLPLSRDDAPSPAIALRGGDTIVAANTTRRVSPGLSLQAWVRFPAFKVGACVLELGDADANGWSLQLTTLRADGALGVRLAEAGRSVTSLDSKRPLAPNVWTHVTVNLTPNEVTLYIGGEQVRSARPTRPPQNPPVVAYAWRSFTVGAVDADVAEVRLFEKPLSDRQVARSVGRTMCGTEPGLAVNWRLDEGRGKVARNSGRLGNDASVATTSACDGAIKGGAWVQHSGLSRARPADARITRALDLDGNGEHARLPGFKSGFGEGYTVEAWVRPDKLDGAPILELCDWRGADGKPRDIDADGKAHDKITLQTVTSGPHLQFVASRGAADPSVPGALRLLTARDVLRPGVWSHVAATVLPSGLVTLHVDGRRVAEGALFKPSEVAADRTAARAVALLGRGAGKTRSLTGAIAEARVWERALTGAELRDRRHLRATGGEQRLARCYHLDAPEVGELADAARAGQAGKLSAGADLRESPDLPLWSSDVRGGAGVDAACKLMQDPRIVTTKGVRKTVHVPSFEVVLSARTADGKPDPGQKLEISADEPVTLRIDRGDGELVQVAPGRSAQVTLGFRGTIRLTIDAGKSQIRGRPALRCPLLKVRTAAMTVGQWEVIAPDAEALDALTTVTGAGLRGGSPAKLGRKQTRGPLPAAVSVADADELAESVRALMGAASQSSLEAEAAGPLDFASDAPADESGPTIGRSPSSGAAARVDGDVPLRRAIPVRVIPAPVDEPASFAADVETREVTLLATSSFEPANDGPQAFGLSEERRASRLARARKLKSDRQRINAKIEAWFEGAGEDIQEWFQELGDNAKELGKELATTLDEALLTPIAEFMTDLKSYADDAVVVVERSFQPGGAIHETFQVVVDTGTRLIRTIVDSVEAAVDIVGTFFARLSAKIEDVIDYLAALFDWDDILETAQVLRKHYAAALGRFPGYISHIRGEWTELIDDAESTVTALIDDSVRALGVADPPPPPEESDERMTLLVGKLQDNAERLSFAPKLPKLDLSLLERLGAALDLGEVRDQLLAALDTIDLDQAFKDPDTFLRTGASALLLALRAAVQLGLRSVKVAGALLLEVVEKVAGWIVEMANARIEIPGFTDFVETTILRGAQLNALTMIAVVAAVPSTVIYKIAHNTTEGPYSAANAGPGSFAEETEEPEDPKFSDRDKAVTGLSCGIISSVFTIVADLAGEKCVPARAVRLICCACGAISGGITGYPAKLDETATRTARHARRLEITGWYFNIIAAAFAFVEGCFAFIQAVAPPGSKDEGGARKYADGFKVASGVWGGVQMVWVLCVSGSQGARRKPKGYEAGAFASSTINSTVGSVTPLLALIPHVGIQIGVNVASVVIQLGSGLAAIFLQDKADAEAVGPPRPTDR